MARAQEYTKPVHRSLLERELILGIPQMGVLILLFFGFIFLSLLRMYYMVFPLGILYITMRVLTKKDPFMIDILIEHINQKEFLVP